MAKRARRGWLIGFLAANWAAGSLAATDPDRDLARVLAEERLAGAVWGIVDGDTARTGAVGLANHARAVPLRDDARVHVGSVTKTLVALGVLRLVSQRRVDLDAPVSTLLPAIALENPWDARRPDTLRHLLDHTAGLDDLRLWHVFTRRATPDSPLADAFRGDADLLRVRVEPGRRFSYSNTSYTLAGSVIEAVTGERYEQWLDRELLGPLGMRDSTFAFTTQTGAGADSRLAWGHYDDLTPVAAMPVWVRPATQFTTTAADMMRLARFMMGDGRVDGVQFIDADALRHMGVAWSTDAGRAGLAPGYALGLAIRDRHGAVGRCHTGSIVGYRAAICLFPRERKAWFTAVNTDSENADYTRIDALMTAALDVSRPASPVVAGPPPRDVAGRYVRAPSRFETFRYFDLLFDSVVLDVADDTLVLRRAGAEPLRLERLGAKLWRAPGRVYASHVLLDGGTFSDGTNTWQRISAWRYYAQAASFAAGIAGLLALLLLVAWRFLRRDRAWTPATFACLLMLAPLPLFALQPFVAIGDVTAASVMLFAASAALPLLTIGHLAWAVRGRERERAWRWHAVAAVAALQWCVVLAVYGLLPFATWR
jgi:CubicO group peptidase (beta-lactamase class C family)